MYIMFNVQCSIECLIGQKCSLTLSGAHHLPFTIHHYYYLHWIESIAHTKSCLFNVRFVIIVVDGWNFLMDNITRLLHTYIRLFGKYRYYIGSWNNNGWYHNNIKYKTWKSCYRARDDLLFSLKIANSLAGSTAKFFGTANSPRYAFQKNAFEHANKRNIAPFNQCQCVEIQIKTKRKKKIILHYFTMHAKVPFFRSHSKRIT